MSNNSNNNGKYRRSNNVYSENGHFKGNRCANRVPPTMPFDPILNPMTMHNMPPDLKRCILETMYPVGSVWMTMSEETPDKVFGFGEWDMFADKFPLGVNMEKKAGQFGGQNYITLGLEQMPPHYHLVNRNKLDEATVEWSYSDTNKKKFDEIECDVVYDINNFPSGKERVREDPNHIVKRISNRTSTVGGIDGDQYHTQKPVPTVPQFMTIHIWWRKA